MNKKTTVSIELGSLLTALITFLTLIGSWDKMTVPVRTVIVIFCVGCLLTAIVFFMRGFLRKKTASTQEIKDPDFTVDRKILVYDYSEDNTLRFTVRMYIKANKDDIEVLEDLYEYAWSGEIPAYAESITSGVTLEQVGKTENGFTLYNGVLSEALKKGDTKVLEIVHHAVDKGFKSDPMMGTGPTLRTRDAKRIDLWLRLDPSLNIQDVRKEIMPKRPHIPVKKKIKLIGGMYVWDYEPDDNKAYQITWRWPDSLSEQEEIVHAS